MESSILHANFYRAFEDKFRGSRDVIRSRLEAYDPFLSAILPYAGERLALDLGCGRGEWLELLRDRGFIAFGVDLDEHMLAASREHNLDVRLMDAIEAVSNAETASLAIISGFHIAEHLPFRTLQTLVSEAHRALIPGGLLILETPNPENLKVASHTFHLDPTHQKPLPPALLQFMTEYYGFAHSKIVRLQERPGIVEASTTNVEDVIFGVSPDYSIVAQKQPSSISETEPNDVFDKSFGVSDHQLISRYDEYSKESLNRLSDELSNIKVSHGMILSAIDQAEDARLAQERNFIILIEKAEASRLLQEQALKAMYDSTSWKITGPLRRAHRALSWFGKGGRAWLAFRPGSRPRRALRSLLTHSMLWMRQRPRLARIILKVLRYSPTLERRLISAAQSRGMALSLRAAESPGQTIWNIDIEPDVIRKWEKLRK